MVARSYFIAQDYDLAFKLQNLFHEYVGLYTKLHYPDSKLPISNIERRELAMKMQDAMNGITLLALQMKQFKSDIEGGQHSDQQAMRLISSFATPF